ncbi:MAG TPA: protein TolR [Pseudomonadales bacterium]
MNPRRQKVRPMAEINVVPYIDVMLVLLVIFMVTAPMLMQGVEVELPKAASKPLPNKDIEPLIVSVRPDGTYYINLGLEPDKAQPLDRVQAQVRAVIKNKPETPVLVWGDHKASYGLVVTLMSALEEAGVPDVGLVTDAPPVKGK